MGKARSFLIASTAFGFALLGPHAWGQEASQTLPSVDSQVASYRGPLQRSPSPTYYPLRSSTSVRAAPSVTAPILITISGQGQALKALGMVVDSNVAAYRSMEDESSRARTWIKVAAAPGQTGFVSLTDLITPKQLPAQKESLRKVALFESEIEAAKKANGDAVPSGIYAHGSACEAEGLSGTSLAEFLTSKFLIWQEGETLHFVQVVNPIEPLLYDQQKDEHPMELRGYGYVMLRIFKSSKDTVFIGYNDKLLWLSSTGVQFDNYQFCGPEAYGTMLRLLRSFANQRPPETR